MVLLSHLMENYAHYGLTLTLWFAASCGLMRSSGSVTFPFGSKSAARVCFNVRDFINNDEVVENTESVFFELTNVSFASTSAITNGTVEVFVQDFDGMQCDISLCVHNLCMFVIQ